MNFRGNRWPLILLLLLVFPAIVFGEDDSAAIRKVMADQQAAWNQGNIEAFLVGYMDSPETTFIGKSLRKGYRPILENYKKNYSTREQMGTLEFRDLEVRLLPADCGVRYAIVTGRYHLDRSPAAGGEASGIFDLVWEKTAHGWKIILDHTS